eukprot:scaffold17559_cov110-Isochrysis_galbana.AAC.15
MKVAPAALQPLGLRLGRVALLGCRTGRLPPLHSRGDGQRMTEETKPGRADRCLRSGGRLEAHKGGPAGQSCCRVGHHTRIAQWTQGLEPCR